MFTIEPHNHSVAQRSLNVKNLCIFPTPSLCVLTIPDVTAEDTGEWQCALRSSSGDCDQPGAGDCLQEAEAEKMGNCSCHEEDTQAVHLHVVSRDVFGITPGQVCFHLLKTMLSMLFFIHLFLNRYS